MPPWIGEMKHTTKSTRYLPSFRTHSNSSSSRSNMYSRSSSSNSSSKSNSSISLLDVVHRIRWVIILVTLLTVLSAVEAVCDPERWWNPEQEACVPCTVCGEQQLVLRPCQEYMDTVCGTMKDLDMDLAQLARTEARHEQRHWKEERRKDGHHPQDHQHGSHEKQSLQHQVASKKKESTEEIMWDWQAASLLLAIIGCLLFFFAAAIIALNQTRQWRRIEKHFDADMEALSAQLMNHLSSMQQLENGSIFLDDVIGGDQRRFRSGGSAAGGRCGIGGDSGGGGLLGGHHHHHHHPIEVRCVYLDQLLDGKNCIKPQGPGNLYIEENNDRGPAVGGGNHHPGRMY